MTENELFESLFPIPEGCIRVGDNYASTDYSAWKAYEYINLWKGWKARAEYTRPSDGEIKLQDDDGVCSPNGTCSSGKTVGLMMDWFFPFGRPVQETIDRLNEHLREYPMISARDWKIKKENIRMCPCGLCNLTWDEAIRQIMNGHAALSREQAEAHLESQVKAK